MSEIPPEVTAPAPIPTLDEVREWLDVPPGDLDDDELARIYWAELADQVAVNDHDPYTHGLAMALLRRCARAGAAKGLPLGTLPLQMTGYPDAYGAMIIPRLDAEIERYEAKTRIIAFA
jgi:hypothetical protein